MDPMITRKTDWSRRVLVVADWDLDPQIVANALAARHRDRPSLYALLVPAGLHGLDWAGEPNASRPCAERQLLALKLRFGDVGIPVERGRVGDPEAGPAISDAVYDWPADEIVLFVRNRRLRVSHPLALARRVERATSLPVTRIRVPSPTAGRRRFRTTPQCAPAAMGAAS
jgi:hypothetical protein